MAPTVHWWNAVSLEGGAGKESENILGRGFWMVKECLPVNGYKQPQKKIFFRNERISLSPRKKKH